MDEYNLALLIIRVALGLTMAAHGYNKFFKGGKIAGTASWFDGMGMRPGRVHAIGAASGEILSGLFLAAGLLTSFAALGFVALMGVAHWTVHRHNGFMILKEGWEYVFVLAVCAITISILGPLEWSIDNMIGWDDDLDGYTGLLISAGGGTAAAVLFLAAFFRPPTSSDS